MRQGEAAREREDSSVLRITSEGAKETLKNLLPRFLFLLLLLSLFLLLLLWTLELGRVTQERKGQGDFLEGKRHSPASPLPRCPADRSGKAGLITSVESNNRAAAMVGARLC